MTSTSPTLATAPATGLWRNAGLAAGVAAIANLVIWGIGKAAGVAFLVTQGSTEREVTFALPIVASVIGVLLGAVALWVLGRLNRGLTIWTGLVAGFGALSLISPLTAGKDTSTGITLALMHAVVVGALLTFLRRPAA